MKLKLHLGLLLLICINNLFSQSIYYSFTNGLIPDSKSGCVNSACIFGPNFETWGPGVGGEEQYNSTIQIRATHGCVGSYPGDGLIFNARYQNNGTWVRGDGILIDYNFKKGYQYNIIINGNFGDDLFDQYTRPYENLPSLQIRATNNPINGELCNSSAQPIDIYSASDPYFEMFANASVIHQNSNATFTFTSPNCYSYLWIASKPNTSGESAGWIYLQNIAVQETGVYTISGSSTICSGYQDYYTLLNNNPLQDPINWTINPSNGIVSSSSIGGNGIRLTKSGNGQVALSTNITNSCNGVITPVSKIIQLGTYTHSQYTIYSYPNTIVYGQTVQFGPLSGQVANATSYNWIYPSGGWTYISGQGTRVLTLKTPIYSPYQTGGDIGLAVGNTCGTSSYFPLTHFNYSNTFNIINVSASPNPAINNININFTDNTNETKLTTNKTISASINTVESKGKTILTLYNINNGMLVKQWIYKEINNKSYNLNINEIKKGVYALQVDRDNNTTIIKIIIE